MAFSDNMTEIEEQWLRESGTFDPHRNDKDLEGFESMSDIAVTRFQRFEDKYKRLFSTFDGRVFSNEKEKLENVGIDGINSSIVTKKALIKFITKMGYSESDIRRINTDNSPNGYEAHYKNIKQWYENTPKAGKPKIKTEFYSLRLGINPETGSGNHLLIVFNSVDLRELCVNNRKKSDYYCKLSIQGLNQPTKFTHCQTYEFLNKFLKRFKLESIDIAVDVKKRGKIREYAQGMKAAVQEEFDTNAKIVVPSSHGATIEDTIYFNTPEKTSPIKGIKFYNKYNKQVYARRDRLESVYDSWFRGEMVVKLNDHKFKECQKHIDTCLESFMNIFRRPGILDEVIIDPANFKLYNRQMKAIKNLKYAKNLYVCPDYVVFKGALKDTMRKKHKFYGTLKDKEVFNNTIVYKLTEEKVEPVAPKVEVKKIIPKVEVKKIEPKVEIKPEAKPDELPLPTQGEITPELVQRAREKYGEDVAIVRVIERDVIDGTTTEHIEYVTRYESKYEWARTMHRQTVYKDVY